jgi:hypothetical protein
MALCLLTFESYELMTYIYFQARGAFDNSRMRRLAVRLTGLKAQTYMSEDNVETCRPAPSKLLMESGNMVLFQAINVKLFLSVISAIDWDPDRERHGHSRCGS